MDVAADYRCAPAHHDDQQHAERGLLPAIAGQGQPGRNSDTALTGRTAGLDLFSDGSRCQQAVVVVGGLVPLDRLPPTAANKKPNPWLESAKDWACVYRVFKYRKPDYCLLFLYRSPVGRCSTHYTKQQPELLRKNYCSFPGKSRKQGAAACHRPENCPDTHV